jgi:hypothetical protein
MLLWIILLLCLFVILFPTFGGKKNRFLREVHPYSGLDPQTWELLQKHLEQYENTKASLDQRAAGLYSAIEDVRNIGLSIRRADDHEHQERLEDIAFQMGVEGETTLFALAQKQGVYFFPKYLNDLPPENTEPDVNRTGASINGHFPDPRSHGQ